MLKAYNYILHTSNLTYRKRIQKNYVAMDPSHISTYYDPFVTYALLKS